MATQRFDMRALNEQSIDLWLCDQTTEVSPAVLHRCQQQLSIAEVNRLQRFHFQRDRRQFLLSHALLRYVLSQYHPATQPADWQFATNAYGKPDIVQHDLAGQLCFNLSHTAGLVVVAVTRQAAIGVDVERIHHFDDLTGVAKRHFATQEMTDFKQLPTPEQTRRFYDLWTLKEAYIKAHGAGLSLPLDQFEFDFKSPGQVAFKLLDGIQDDPKRWQFMQYQATDHHVIAVACQPATGIGPKRHYTGHQVIPMATITPCDIQPQWQS